MLVIFNVWFISLKPLSFFVRGRKGTKTFDTGLMTDTAHYISIILVTDFLHFFFFIFLTKSLEPLR